MKVLIKEIDHITADGISFTLTGNASLNGGLSADRWFVTWDKIGKALFGEKYYESDDTTELKILRGEHKRMMLTG